MFAKIKNRKDLELHSLYLKMQGLQRNRKKEKTMRDRSCSLRNVFLKNGRILSKDNYSFFRKTNKKVNSNDKIDDETGKI